MRHAGASGAHASQDRAWAVVRAAHAAREPLPARRRRAWRAHSRALLALLLGVVVAAFALSPAGASVRDWIERRIDPPPPATTLPAHGRLLVTNADGAWVVGHDLSTRWLGAYATASWSPRGRFVLAARRDLLAALDPQGRIRWTLTRPNVSHAAWSLGDGYRVAYRSRHVLRVVAGDGTGDHRLAARTANVTPAWRPPPPAAPGEHVLAYATRRGEVVVRDVDSAGPRTAWLAAGPTVQALAWADADRLLVLRGGRVEVVAFGMRLATIGLPGGRVPTEIAASPDGVTLALLADDELWTVRVPDAAALKTSGGRPPDVRTRRRLAADGPLRGIAWSPDGSVVSAGDPAGNAWTFVPATGGALRSIGGVSALLDPGARAGATGDRGFAIAGWSR